jgi:alpha-tubulin suppressor-like RCC1 family protein
MGDFNSEHASRFRRTGSIGAIFITACMYLVVPSPVRVRANVSISEIDPTGRIAAGDKHTCAIAVNDTIWCWGDNSFSQLGSSDFLEDLSLVPVQTAALPGSRIAERIVAGANHTCVLATDGTVWCWGQNGNGNLGDGSFSTQGDPRQALLGTTAVMIAAGGSTTCAALSNNTLKCWGKGNSGQIGNNLSLLSNATPVDTPVSFTVAHLEIGSTHSCAISTIGVAWCWGEFTNGRLGTTAMSNAANPTATALLGGVASEVAAGGTHTCVLLVNGTVTCFGYNDMGQLGQTPTQPASSNSTPTVVTLAATATHVSVGKQFTCALLSTAAVRCFGDNASGQLGSGSSGSARNTPNEVTELTGTVVDVVAGAAHACAVMSTGEVRCWGFNDSGQLGIGTNSNVAKATAIATLNIVPTTTSTTVAPTTIAPTTVAPTTVPPTTVVVAAVEPEVIEPIVAEPTSTSTSTLTTAITTSTASSTSTSSTVVMASVAVLKAKVVVLIRPMVMRRGSNVSAAKLAASVSMTIPKRSVGTMRISITKGSKYCAFVGTSLKAMRPGKCTIVVIYLPKKGPSVLRRNTLTVRK